MDNSNEHHPDLLKTAFAILSDVLSDDAEGCSILTRFRSDPLAEAGIVADWLRARGKDLQIVNRISGQVETVVTVGRTDKVHFNFVKPKPRNLKILVNEYAKQNDTPLLERIQSVSVVERRHDVECVLQITEGLRNATCYDDLRRLASSIKELMPQLTRSGEERDQVSILIGEFLENLIDSLISMDNRFLSLLQLRAEFRDKQARFADALSDIQVLISSSNHPDASTLLLGGSLMLTLGNWVQAQELLAQAQRGQLTEAERLEAQRLTLWFHDYQGRPGLVLEYSDKLLKKARAMDDPDLFVAIEHRRGRAAFTAALLANNNRELMERSLFYLKNAKKLALKSRCFVQVYHENWIYRVSQALLTRDRHLCWERTKEYATEFQDEPSMAHVLLSETARAVADNKTNKVIDLSMEVLRIWKKHEYAKGVFDASLQLAHALSACSQFEAAIYYRLAERLGTRLQLPRVTDASWQLNTLVENMQCSRRYLLEKTDDQLEEMTFSKLLHIPRISVPGQQ